MKTTFKAEWEDPDMQVELSTNEVSWPELAVAFVHFLKGCGFELSFCEEHLAFDYGCQDEKETKEEDNS